MERTFAIYNFTKDEIITKMNEYEYDIYCSLFIKRFNNIKCIRNLHNFTIFFNQVFWTSGKPHKWWIDDDKSIESDKILLVELLPSKNGKTTPIRIINSADIYLNQKEVDTHKYTMDQHFYRGIDLKWKYKRPHYDYNRDYSDWDKHDLSKDRWITDNPSYRKVRYRHDVLALDDKFYKENDEPLARRPKGGKEEIYERYEQPVSQTANWKNVSKDKHQWEHNLKSKLQSEDEWLAYAYRPGAIVDGIKQPSIEERIEILRNFLKNNDFVEDEEDIEDEA